MHNTQIIADLEAMEANANRGFKAIYRFKPSAFGLDVAEFTYRDVLGWPSRKYPGCWYLPNFGETFESIEDAQDWIDSKIK